MNLSDKSEVAKALRQLATDVENDEVVLTYLEWEPVDVYWPYPSAIPHQITIKASQVVKISNSESFATAPSGRFKIDFTV